MKSLFLLNALLCIISLSAADDSAIRKHIERMQALSMQAEDLAAKLDETVDDFKDVVDPLLSQHNSASSHVVPEYPAKVTFLPLGDDQREMQIEYVGEPRIMMWMRPQGGWTAMWSANEDSPYSERLIKQDDAFVLAWVKEEKATFIAKAHVATSSISTDNAIND